VRGLGVGAGAAAARFRVPPTKESLQVVRAAQRVGLPITPDVARAGLPGSAGIQKRLAQVGQLPGGFAIRERFMRRFVPAMNKKTDEIFKRTTPLEAREAGGAASKAAGRAIKAVRATAVKAGRITKARQKQQRAAFDAEGEKQIGAVGLSLVERGVSTVLRAGTERGEKVSTGMTAIMRRFFNQAKKAGEQNRTLTVQELENFRGEIAEFSKIMSRTPNFGAFDSRVAKAFNDSVNQVYQLKAPLVAKAQSAARGLRVSLEQLKPPKGNLVIDTESEIASILGSKNFNAAWTVFKKNATPQEVDAFRGRYLAMLVERISLKAEEGKILSLNSLRNVQSKGGQFRGDKTRRILGKELMQEIEDLGRVADEVYQGIGKPQGSATGTRVAGAAEFALSSTAMMAAWAFMSNSAARTAIVLNALNAGGVRMFLNSFVNGKVGQTMNRLATGEGVGIPARATVAVGREGGFFGQPERGRPGIVGDVRNVSQGVAGGISQAIPGIRNLLSSEEQP
jgi:hypothetical protein